MAVLAGAVLTLAVAAFLFTTHGAQGPLLRADPDALPADTALFQSAVRSGKPLFAAHCASCHGDGGATPVPGAANLADGDWLYGAGRLSEIEEITNFGIRAQRPRTWSLADMPAYATPVPSKREPLPPLTPAQLRDVTEYVYGFQHSDADAAARTRGATLFQDTAGCYDCHSSDAAGDSSIGAPNLTDAIWLSGDGGREAIAAVIARGMSQSCPGWWGRLKPYETRAIAAYVYSLSLKHAGPT
jgi:cytochrome c oxidase cbb3-type subunit 3